MAKTVLRPLTLRADPAQVLRVWPADWPLAVLWSARDPSPGGVRWSRWSVLARPRTTRSFDDPRTLSTLGLIPDSPTVAHPTCPFVGGHLVMLGYELGQIVEPRASGLGSSRPRRWPAAVICDCDDALIHDHATGAWFAAGSMNPADLTPADAAIGEFELEAVALRPGEADRSAFLSAAARAVQYIHAGDIFQANLSHALRAGFRGSARALALTMFEAAQPWYGAYIEWPGHAVVSASPELFLQLDTPKRTLTTRPIKGTRPGDAAAGDLLASSKDAAELNMIIDLMRNDLGRICEFGSIRVTEPRAVERHAHDRTGRGVLHGVATIQGALRAGCSITDVLAATFPGGSITGAPKIRAMQIINELELRERGPYTGSIGYISRCGNACFNIAIRTAAIRSVSAYSTGRDAALGLFDQALLEYGVGAGIVAESDPQAEWYETLAKAAAMVHIAERSGTVCT